MVMKKPRVAVLMGGKSPEYEISLMTGGEVVRNLDPTKYQVLPIVVSRDGITWQIGERENFLLDSPTTKVTFRQKTGSKPSSRKSKVKSLVSADHASLIKSYGVDIVFIAMHGPYGEDGRVQGFLDLIGVPYTGSGVLASALGMDKISSRKLFTQEGLTVPKCLILEKSDSRSKVWKKLKPPVFVKPSNQGSSVGTTKVHTKKELAKALKTAFSYSQFALVEEYLRGTEITVPILGNNRPYALPVIEIVSEHEFFDYQAKYTDGITKEIVPARINKYLTKKAQEAALAAYQTLGCRGFGRVDMIIRGGKIYVLEVNTIPGLTPVSLFPKAAKVAGISYPMLLDKIIGFALKN